MEASMRLFVILATVVSPVLPTTTTATLENDHNIGALNDLIENDPASLCVYIRCQEPLSATQCPDGTHYMEAVAQFGCCGACVKFQQFNQTCTGSVDPQFGGGYSYKSKLQVKETKRSRNKQDDSITWNLRSSIMPSVQVRNVLQSAWCDYNLNCTQDQTCQYDSLDKGCFYVQRQYDQVISDGSYLPYRDDYRWRPECNQVGQYAEKQCKGVGEERRCICVDPDGNRLFGDAFPDQSDAFNTMNCKCSREVWERTSAGESSVTLHCAENGNYDAFQCEDGWCYCVDPATGTLTGPRLPENAADHLICYNMTTVGEQYLRRCESQLHAHWELYDVMANRGVQGNPTPLINCSLDGSYAGMQCDQIMCRCYDKYLTWIAAPAGPGCQCARDQQYYTDNGIQKMVSCVVGTGVYEEKQKLGGIVYCVDEDGIRSGPVVYLAYERNLNCPNSAACQAGDNTVCRIACMNCPTIAYPNYA